MSLADRLAKAQQRDRIAEVRSRVQERLVEVQRAGAKAMKAVDFLNGATLPLGMRLG